MDEAHTKEVKQFASVVDAKKNIWGKSSYSAVDTHVCYFYWSETYLGSAP